MLRILIVLLGLMSTSLMAQVHVEICITEQKLYLYEADSLIQSYPISSAVNGVGNQSGSGKTPLGLHEVARKYGEGAPEGAVFRGRKYNGEIAEIYTDDTDLKEDLVTTRVLWLRGLEDGINRGEGIDSFKRYIYIHGTNEEGLIGTPASHGCIRMRNRDVIALFELLPLRAEVLIKL